jgi:hypothetical protein
MGPCAHFNMPPSTCRKWTRHACSASFAPRRCVWSHLSPLLPVHLSSRKPRSPQPHAGTSHVRLRMKRTRERVHEPPPPPPIPLARPVVCMLVPAGHLCRSLERVARESACASIHTQTHSLTNTHTHTAHLNGSLVRARAQVYIRKLTHSQTHTRALTYTGAGRSCPQLQALGTYGEAR